MNYKILATTMFMSIALGAYSAPIYTVLDMSSVSLIQSESETGRIESDGEKLLAFSLPKDNSKSSKKAKEVEEDDSDEDEEIDDTDDYEEDDDLESDDDSDDNDDDDEDDEDEVLSSNRGGFADIKSTLEENNKSLPESKSEYHIHKNAPAKTITNRLDPQGLITEYITYFYGDEIEMKHTVTFLGNGNVNCNGSCKANFQANTPAKSWNNSKKVNGKTIMDFYYFNGKVKATFTLTPLRNGTTNVDYQANVIDPNI